MSLDSLRQFEFGDLTNVYKTKSNYGYSSNGNLFGVNTQAAAKTPVTPEDCEKTATYQGKTQNPFETTNIFAMSEDNLKSILSNDAFSVNPSAGTNGELDNHIEQDEYRGNKLHCWC